MKSKLNRFIEKNKLSAIYKGKRTEDLEKVTFWFDDGTRQTIAQNIIDELIKLGNPPRWKGKDK